MRTHRTRAAPTPTLRFSPYSWAKLLFLRDAGDTEVGGFGISAEDDPLLIVDFVLVRQTCSWASVKFHDEAVADFFDEQVDNGKTCESFCRVWCHTHPGECPQPSSVDEATFARVFGSCDWSLMFIIAQGGDTYARLWFGVGPGGEMQIPVEVDYSHPFDGTDFAAWMDEYEANVIKDVPVRKIPHVPYKSSVTLSESDQQELFDNWEELDAEYRRHELLMEWEDVWHDYVDESASAQEVR